MRFGEACKQLSPEVRERNGAISWKAIAGTRYKLIHAYFGVDLVLVWAKVNEDLPVLRKAVASEIALLGSERGL